MIQSWENFMSPSGGAMENDLEFGMSSFFVDIGASLSINLLIKPWEKEDLLKIGGRYNAREEAAASRLAKNTEYIGPRGKDQYQKAFGENIRNRHFLNRKTPDRGDIHFSKQAADVRARYGKMRAGARAIGWGYIALAAASMVEGLASPGLSTSAEMNNAKTMGMTPPLDSSQAYTQRQRALMAIHDSQLGIRNVIGSEAGFLHR